MAIIDFLKKQFIDVIEWTDDSRDTLSFRFPDEDKEIKNGAQLIFSSQDVSTMCNDVFRRDEIWFAARAEGEASQLWSPADTQPWRMRSV